MKPHRPPSRALTTLAVGFLTLDALLLTYGGLSLGRPRLVVGGAVCLVVAVLVILGWRRYRRALSELERARREMRAEVESIKDLLHRATLHH
jgi:hypothetical protein